MDNHKVASSYAGALFQVALSGKVETVIESELRLIFEILSNNKKTKRLVFSYSSPYHIKRFIIDNLISCTDLHRFTKTFLELLLDNNKLAALYNVIVKFNNLRMRQYEFKIVNLTTVSRDQDFINFIKRDIEKKLDSQVIVNNVEDRNILGGFIIKIDNVMMDCSLRTKLNKLSRILG